MGWPDTKRRRYYVKLWIENYCVVGYGRAIPVDVFYAAYEKWGLDNCNLCQLTNITKLLKVIKEFHPTVKLIKNGLVVGISLK